jgi:Bacterial PH domain
MEERTYRDPSRRVFLCLGFLALAAFLGGAAALATGVARVVLTSLAVPVAALAVRSLFFRLVATAGGLRVHGPLGNRAYAWSEIERIEVGRDSVNSMNPLMIFSHQWVPVAYLTNGRRVRLTEITSYTIRESARDGTMAARAARELELARVAAP